MVLLSEIYPDKTMSKDKPADLTMEHCFQC